MRMSSQLAGVAANQAVHGLLRFFAANFNHRPALRDRLKTADGYLAFTVGFRTESGAIEQHLRFADGRVEASGRRPERVDASLIFRDEDALVEMLRLPPHEVMHLLMRGRIRTEGNLSLLSLFSHLSALLQRSFRAPSARRAASPPPCHPSPSARRERLAAEPRPNAPFLRDPYLGNLGLEDFPRLRRFLGDHLSSQPEICAERPALLTEWFRENGFETDREGRPWDPVLRQAHAFKHLMEHKRPLVREGDLLAGTTTAKEVGVVIYPDAHGTLIWGELSTAGERPLNPYTITEQTARTLHEDVFPFWTHRNFREWVRQRHHEPLCQRLDDRFAVYFSWKTVALSHTVPDFPRLLARGIAGLLADIEQERGQTAPDDEQKQGTLEAMRLTLLGLRAYAKNLAAHVRSLAAAAAEEGRRRELEQMAAVCERAPEHPAVTLHEALQAIWTTWIALHMENTNAGLSLGRLDQWLQPYFEADMAALPEAEQGAYVERAVELCGCFFLRLADHLPLVPDIGNYLFGGSSSDQAITLGGVRPDGRDAVNDMTYVLLKVTELLKLRDPNINARYSHQQNDQAYLNRLCEVNLITAATPSIHGDENVIRSLSAGGYELEHVRDWSSTGCVEPTLSGRHMGHTGSMMFNLVAALEMALNDGLHPLMRWRVGPETGSPEAGAFASFEAFFSAYRAQLAFLVEQAVTYNNWLGEAHSVIRPTPLLSSLIDGPREKGRDVTLGGARYNTSGVACIGLSDVVDSLVVIRRLVFEERRVRFAELKTALSANFVGHDRTRALAGRVPKYGSGDPTALEMAGRVTALVHQLFSSRTNFRGGPYTTGFWSMSNHVAFGGLTGALPSGRLAGKAFTPGLTPSPQATPNLLDNLRDVALLDPRDMDNNVAFNVKYVPSAQESHAQAVEHMAGYAKAYFTMGGMQMQLNVVSSAVLRDAMEHPEDYRDLLVRISGYNAYFVTLNRDMQVELIERAEYGG